MKTTRIAAGIYEAVTPSGTVFVIERTMDAYGTPTREGWHLFCQTEYGQDYWDTYSTKAEAVASIQGVS